MGRDMIYDSWTCDLLVGASASQVYRLNLDRGQFMAPFDTESDAINCVRFSALHGLYGFAGDNGTLEFWDRRDRSRLGIISMETLASAQQVPLNGVAEHASLELTSLLFLPDGLHFASGTSDGRVLLFDLRKQSEPLLVRDHFNGFAIKKIDYHASSGCLVSSDSRSIKFWHVNSTGSTACPPGTLFTTIESEADINEFCLRS